MQLPQRPQLRIALERAQARTTAPIHVAVSSLFWGSVHNFGDAAFRKLAISACPERNGVLLLIVPRRRRFVVLGDLAVHARVGQRQWDTLAATIASAAAPQQGYPYAYAIAQLGNLLALHYPSSSLADDVASSSPVSSTAGSNAGTTAGTARRGDDEFEIAFEDQTLAASTADKEAFDINLSDTDALAVAIAFDSPPDDDDDADTGKHRSAQVSASK